MSSRYVWQSHPKMQNVSTRFMNFEWALEPEFQFSMPEPRINPVLLMYLSKYPPSHPLIMWLNVFQHPTTTLRAIYRKMVDDEKQFSKRRRKIPRHERLAWIRNYLAMQFQNYLDSFTMKVAVTVDPKGRFTRLRIKIDGRSKGLECRILAAILAVLAEGKIASLARCRVCNGWMQKRQTNQWCCGDKRCKQAAYQADPEVRARKRLYSKNKYWEDKSKAIRLSKRLI